MISQILCYHCAEYIKFYTCTKFYDQSNNNRIVMEGGGGIMPPSPGPMTDGSKKAHVK